MQPQLSDADGPNPATASSEVHPLDHAQHRPLPETILKAFQY